MGEVEALVGIISLLVKREDAAFERWARQGRNYFGDQQSKDRWQESRDTLIVTVNHALDTIRIAVTPTASSSDEGSD